jgi:hypothetical protein
MYVVSPDERVEFPRAGYRARRWQRFERDLREWLETPDGRFAEWRARRELAGAQAAQLAQSPLTTTSE